MYLFNTFFCNSSLKLHSNYEWKQNLDYNLFKFIFGNSFDRYLEKFLIKKNMENKFWGESNQKNDFKKILSWKLNKYFNSVRLW